MMELATGKSIISSLRNARLIGMSDRIMVICEPFAGFVSASGRNALCVGWFISA